MLQKISVPWRSDSAPQEKHMEKHGSMHQLFTTNKVMKEHAKKHSAIWVEYDHCDKSFVTTDNKKQHEKGAHGLHPVDKMFMAW